MQVGNQVHYFKNINLKGYSTYTKKFTYRDTRKNIVHKKYIGYIRRILQDGERLSEAEINKYAQNHRLVKKGFETKNGQDGVRILVEFPERKTAKYMLFSEHLWIKCTDKSPMGYIRIVPNSVRFIMDDI